MGKCSKKLFQASSGEVLSFRLRLRFSSLETPSNHIYVCMHGDLTREAGPGRSCCPFRAWRNLWPIEKKKRKEEYQASSKVPRDFGVDGYSLCLVPSCTTYNVLECLYLSADLLHSVCVPSDFSAIAACSGDENSGVVSNPALLAGSPLVCSAPLFPRY